jgi:hypothetical protein
MTETIGHIAETVRQDEPKTRSVTMQKSPVTFIRNTQGYHAPFIRWHPHHDVGDEAVPPRLAVAGLYGLVPHWD